MGNPINMDENWGYRPWIGKHMAESNMFWAVAAALFLRESEL